MHNDFVAPPNFNSENSSANSLSKESAENLFGSVKGLCEGSGGFSCSYSARYGFKPQSDINSEEQFFYERTDKLSAYGGFKASLYHFVRRSGHRAFECQYMLNDEFITGDEYDEIMRELNYQFSVPLKLDFKHGKYEQEILKRNLQEVKWSEGQEAITVPIKSKSQKKTRRKDSSASETRAKKSPQSENLKTKSSELKKKKQEARRRGKDKSRQLDLFSMLSK